MKETINGVPPSVVASLSKEAILDALRDGYERAKPINDQMVDISLHIQRLSTEVYRRAIGKQFPEMPVTRLRTVMRVSVSVHPNQGVPQLIGRIAELRAQGVDVISVAYDENTGEFSFYAKPEHTFPNIPTTQPDSSNE